MSFYSVAELYDSINGSAYEPYADFLEQSFKEASIKVTEVLDLGCGTGGISALLAGKGFDMVALDNSPEMLNIARERNYGKNTLLLCQDMREFELFGTVQAVYSSFDCLNYIIDPAELVGVFALVKNYLEPGGVFIFDVNTEYRYKEILDGNSYIYEFENDMAIWRSAYSAETRLCEFEIDLFSKQRSGLYSRMSETQLQRLHSKEEILAAAKGFTLLRTEAAKGFDGCSENEKTYYIFRRD